MNNYVLNSSHFIEYIIFDMLCKIIDKYYIIYNIVYILYNMYNIIHSM